MTVYVADTHMLLWYLFSPNKLSEEVLNVLSSMGEDDLLVIPALVVAEMMMVVEKQRIQATMDQLKTVLSALQLEESCLFPPLTSEDILASASLQQIPDIFDRLIAFEAHKRNAILITRDEVLTQSDLVKTIW